MPPLIAETEVNGNTRFPAGVLTMSKVTRERSSCGARATSRTRPLAVPEASYTIEPNSSLSETVAILKRILKSVWGYQMNDGVWPKKDDHHMEHRGTQRKHSQIER